MHAYIYRYIIEPHLIYAALIYCCCPYVFMYLFYILRYTVDANQLFGSTRKNFPRLTLKPQRCVPAAFSPWYELSEIQHKPG